MIKIRFPNSDSERKALGYLAGRFPFKTLVDGYTLVPEAALSWLTEKDISFTVAEQAAIRPTRHSDDNRSDGGCLA